MKIRGISRNVVALGIVSFFTDVASEMLYPVIPLFLVGTLGISPGLLGVIEGLADGVASGLRWFGGILSDRMGRRKPFVVFGYGLSAASKPIMGAAAFGLGWPVFLCGRLTDRLGKSVRTAARDALIADSTPLESRGIAFGFHRMMDTLGAITGPLLTLLVLWVIPNIPLERLFLFAVIPGGISCFIAYLAVRDISRPKPPVELAQKKFFQPYNPLFYRVLVAFALFSLGASSDTFLILAAKEAGMSFNQIMLLYALFNAVYAFSSFPLGGLSDRIGRKPIILTGWGLYVLVYFGFALWDSPGSFWVLFAAYGLCMALTEGSSKALVNDLVPMPQRAGALGLWSAVGGIGQWIAGITAGLCWNLQIGGSIRVAFLIGGCWALAGLIMLAPIRIRLLEKN